MNRRDLLILALLAPAITASASRARTQDRYPSRPVRLVIPSVPAGVHDVIGRVWAERVKPQFGTIVIDNRGGGGGSIGANDVAHAQPDGYSILLGSTSTHVLVPPTMANPPYDPVKDFSAVCVFAYSSTSIVVHPSLPVRTLAELIAYARAHPGKLSYGAAGTGSITNLAGEYFKQLAGGLDIPVVPYRGIGQGLADLASGQIPMFSANARARRPKLSAGAAQAWLRTGTRCWSRQGGGNLRGRARALDADSQIDEHQAGVSARVAVWVERSKTRGTAKSRIPDFAALHPGYALKGRTP